MIKTEAIILKTADLGETDRLLTIYTKEFGKIKVIAKGIKKLESKLRYSLEPFSWSHLILIEGKNFQIVKDAILINQFLNIRNDLDKLKIAKEIIDFVDEAIIGEEQDKNIWNLFTKTLAQLNVGGLASNMAKDFREKLFRLLGYDPEQVKDIEDIY